MAKLHDTSVTGNINASGTIYANGKAVAPLDHTHNIDAITGLEQSVKNIVNSAPVDTATNATQLGGKAADQYALKTELTALGERLNQIQYSITKVFKCPNYVSSSYDNKYVKITLSDRIANSTKAIIVEDDTKKFIINVFAIPTFFNNKIIIKDKINVGLYYEYDDIVPTIYRVSDTTFIVGGICVFNDNELASITLQSNEPITADDFTISGRDHAYNLNSASAKKTLSSRDLIPHFAEKYADTRFGYLYTMSKPKTSEIRLDLHLESAFSNIYIYSLSETNKIVLGINSNGITSWYADSYEHEPRIAIRGLTVYIDLSTLSNDFVILGDCTASYSTSNIPSFATLKTLPAFSGISDIDESNALTYNQVLDLLGRSILVNGNHWDIKYNIDTSGQSYPTIRINDQSIVIGANNVLTARANGGNADTVGGLSPNSFITTDKLVTNIYSKVAVYDNQNHLVHPDGTEEWIEYKRPAENTGVEIEHL